MNVLILGAGAVGLGIAAKLSEVVGVTALTREGPAGTIAEHGLTLEGAWGNGTYRFPCSSKPPAGVHFDYILITTKAYMYTGVVQVLCGVAPEFRSGQSAERPRVRGNNLGFHGKRDWERRYDGFHTPG